ncbi:MAG: pseudouridine synthase [Alphaproteobacteria bacterium]|nr:MAG: pseudouridine synthase [Alphaproteobacteria bacterium]
MAPLKESTKDTQRIAKLMARAGVASRREIERMIAEGRIAIDGKTVETPATLLASLHGVTVDGQPVKAPAPARLFRYHKPAGLLTAERDPKGRPTIYDRLPKDLPRVMPVGRLDLNTEGLLLLTTDGELKRQLELPATGVERSYRARVFGEISQAQLEELIHGIEIEGVRYGAIDANLERRTGRNAWVEMRLREGKNREVRRVLEHLGLQVSRLIRTAYGPFPVADLAPGAVEEVRQHDLVEFRRMLSGLKPMAAPESSEHRPRPARPPAPKRAFVRRNAPRDERPAVAPARPPRARTGPPREERPADAPPRPSRARTGPPREERARTGPARNVPPREDRVRSGPRREERERRGKPGGRPQRSGPARGTPTRGGPGRGGPKGRPPGKRG